MIVFCQIESHEDKFETPLLNQKLTCPFTYMHQHEVGPMEFQESKDFGFINRISFSPISIQVFKKMITQISKFDPPMSRTLIAPHFIVNFMHPIEPPHQYDRFTILFNFFFQISPLIFLSSYLW